MAKARNILVLVSQRGVKVFNAAFGWEIRRYHEAEPPAVTQCLRIQVAAGFSVCKLASLLVKYFVLVKRRQTASP